MKKNEPSIFYISSHGLIESLPLEYPAPGFHVQAQQQQMVNAFRLNFDDSHLRHAKKMLKMELQIANESISVF